ncbi:thiol:disulfide interchange protein [Paraburkholderia graminis]|uniref:Thiol:disulfide interchange protein n=3 Tax=Burkholderiaceae TaxID=119060 RepID=A0ABD5CR86_9BURK|nr:thiol:disulfide interchange protein [Paraburkholderia graminis]
MVADGGIYALLGPYAIANLQKECRLQASMVVEPAVPRFIALAMSPHGELTLACRTVMQLTREIARSRNLSSEFQQGVSAAFVRPI